MITVIRVEHPSDGIGIFARCGKSIKSISEYTKAENAPLNRLWNRHSTCSPTGGFPCPQQEGLSLEKHGKKWHCAFKTVEQVQQWIKHDEFIELFKLGFRVYMLDVTEYQEGLMQVVYTKSGVMQSKDVTDLF